MSFVQTLKDTGSSGSAGNGGAGPPGNVGECGASARAGEPAALPAGR